jgi:hypothetical protein
MTAFFSPEDGCSIFHLNVRKTNIDVFTAVRRSDGYKSSRRRTEQDMGGQLAVKMDFGNTACGCSWLRIVSSGALWY